MLLCCSEHANLLKETLEKQFEVVKERVSRNGTYMQGSHVLQFGSLSIDEEPVGDYLGDGNTGKPEGNKWYMVILSPPKISSSFAHMKLHHVQLSPTNTTGSAVTVFDVDFGCTPLPTWSSLVCVGHGAVNAVEDPAYAHSVSQRDAELLPLYIAVEQASNGAQTQQAAAALQQALAARSSVDQAIRHTVSTLLSLPEVTSLLQVSMHMPDTLDSLVT